MKRSSHYVVLFLLLFIVLISFQCNSNNTPGDSDTQKAYLQDDLQDVSNAGYSLDPGQGNEGSKSFDALYYTYIDLMIATIGIAFLVFGYWQVRLFISKSMGNLRSF